MLLNRDRFTSLAENGKLRYATLGVTGLLVIGAAVLGITSGGGEPTPASAIATDRTAEDQAARGAEREPVPTQSPSATPTPTKETPKPAKATEKPAEEPKKPANTGGDNVDIPADCSDLSGSRAIGCAVMLDSGFGMDQWSCLDTLWDHESGWNVHAENTSSGAYGIPQALPGSKMGTAGDDWQNSAATQVKWGLGYIKGRYGSPCGAWGYWQSNGWY